MNTKTTTDPQPSSALPPGLLQRLQALATAPGRRWPGGESLAVWMARSDAPPATRVRLARAVHMEWLKGETEPSDELQDAFIECVDWAWEGLDDDDRLDTGLYQPFVRAIAARQPHRLGELAARLAPFAGHAEAGHSLAVLLRHLRQTKQLAALQELLDALRPAWRPGLAWGGAPLLGGVLALSREADDFAALRSTAAWLPALLDAAETGDSTATGKAEPDTWPELGKLALRTLQVDPMQRASAALLRRTAETNDDEFQGLLVQMLSLLSGIAPDVRTRALLDRAAKQWPGLPAILHGRARIAHAEGATPAELLRLMDGLDADLPGGPTAMSWLAGTMFHGGKDMAALELYRELAKRDALTAADRLRMNHLLARDTADDDAATAEDGAAAAPPEPALAAEALLPFAPALAPLQQLLDNPPLHDAPLDAEALASAGESACRQWRSALPRLTDISMQACLRAARQLAQLEAAAFASHSQWIDAFPFALGPAYGRIDAQRSRALSHALHRHVIALCDFALDRPHALQGTPAQASLRHARELAQIRCEARWALGEGDQALADVQALQERLGPLGERPLRELQVRCRLSRRDGAGPVDAELAAIPALLADAADSAGPDDVLALRSWREWLAAEKLPPRVVLADHALEGRFESVRPDGRVYSHAHRLAETELSVLQHGDLRVRNSHLVIGPGGGILRPGPWHLSMGDYPYEHRHVRLRGGGNDAIGAVLRPARWRKIDKPVVVLANQDATYHRNYYHWMLLILARVVGLRDHGLLKGRKLLVPRELSGWMRTSLEAVGVTDKHMLQYGDDDDLHLTDALLVSPIDFASPSLVEGLRNALWRYAGLDPTAPPPATRLLYISRRGEGRRPLVEEARIQRAAESLGFEAVAPETLPLAEQVRLFASARGVAGPPGAAYTNLIWAGAGTRVLSIFKEEANLPTFVDLSIIRGQPHRWLLGRNLPGYALMSIVNAPFSVDIGLAERELAWVAGKE